MSRIPYPSTSTSLTSPRQASSSSTNTTHTQSQTSRRPPLTSHSGTLHYTQSISIPQNNVDPTLNSLSSTSFGAFATKIHMQRSSSQHYALGNGRIRVEKNRVLVEKHCEPHIIETSVSTSRSKKISPAQHTITLKTGKDKDKDKGRNKSQVQSTLGNTKPLSSSIKQNIPMENQENQKIKSTHPNTHHNNNNIDMNMNMDMDMDMDEIIPRTPPVPVQDMTLWQENVDGPSNDYNTSLNSKENDEQNIFNSSLSTTTRIGPLWDSSPTAPDICLDATPFHSETISFKQSALNACYSHFVSSESPSGFFLGRLTSRPILDAEGHGGVIIVDRFDIGSKGNVSIYMPGDVVLKVFKQEKTIDPSSPSDTILKYFSEVAMSAPHPMPTGTMTPDYPTFLPIAVTIKIDALQRLTVRCFHFSPNATTFLTPIHPLRVVLTKFAKSILNGSIKGSGPISISANRSLLLLEPGGQELPHGIWVTALSPKSWRVLHAMYRLPKNLVNPNKVLVAVVGRDGGITLFESKKNLEKQDMGGNVIGGGGRINFNVIQSNSSHYVETAMDIQFGRWKDDSNISEWLNEIPKGPINIPNHFENQNENDGNDDGEGKGNGKVDVDKMMDQNKEDFKLSLTKYSGSTENEITEQNDSSNPSHNANNNQNIKDIDKDVPVIADLLKPAQIEQVLMHPSILQLFEKQILKLSSKSSEIPTTTTTTTTTTSIATLTSPTEQCPEPQGEQGEQGEIIVKKESSTNTTTVFTNPTRCDIGINTTFSVPKVESVATNTTLPYSSTLPHPQQLQSQQQQEGHDEDIKPISSESILKPLDTIPELPLVPNELLPLNSLQDDASLSLTSLTIDTPTKKSSMGCGRDRYKLLVSYEKSVASVMDTHPGNTLNHPSSQQNMTAILINDDQDGVETKICKEKEDVRNIIARVASDNEASFFIPRHMNDHHDNSRNQERIDEQKEYHDYNHDHEGGNSKDDEIMIFKSKSPLQKNLIKQNSLPMTTSSTMPINTKTNSPPFLKDKNKPHELPSSIILPRILTPSKSISSTTVSTPPPLPPSHHHEKNLTKVNQTPIDDESLHGVEQYSVATLAYLKKYGLLSSYNKSSMMESMVIPESNEYLIPSKEKEEKEEEEMKKESSKKMESYSRVLDFTRISRLPKLQSS